ncbi:MAG: ABC transporter substrate-binding protein [Acidimicrobiia bacterium]|nr:ABC transporter substrate-binding protein [Acidimicrobiia bacterium]
MSSTWRRSPCPRTSRPSRTARSSRSSATPRAREDESFVMLNTAVAPFDQQIAREALAHATDREGYNDTHNGGEAQVAEGPYRPESRWHHDVDYPEYDPDRARELVEQYEAEHGPFEFTLLTNPSVRVVQGASLLQQQWQDVGIDVEIQTTETASQISQVVVGDFQATTWRQFGSAHPFLEEPWWTCDYVEPIPEISLNFARNCNEELSREMAEARKDGSGMELDDDGAAVVSSEELKPYYDRVQELLAEDLPYIWLHHIRTGVVAAPELTGALDFTLPSGSPGLAFNNGAHPVHQIWLADRSESSD